eukprot:TRINITY_DN18544_c0_g1_i1.p1 TRINITY_DN18544_c0_g1~~TRINITY_DN18544_c0_g1_i1.p1  ORF type:complete len:791 (+),score=146.59 TRINITY_DN18544_c0_g1_i1:63-2435(+)
MPRRSRSRSATPRRRHDSSSSDSRRPPPQRRRHDTSDSEIGSPRRPSVRGESRNRRERSRNNRYRSPDRSRARDRDRDRSHDHGRGSVPDRDRRDQGRDDRVVRRESERGRDDNRDRRGRGRGDDHELRRESERDRGTRDGRRDVPFDEKEPRKRRDASSGSSGSSSSSSSTASSERRAKKEKKAAKRAKAALKKEKKKEKKIMKKAEKEGAREGQYMEKLSKGVMSMFESNARTDRGRPLSLVKAGLSSALQIAMGLEMEPGSMKSQVIPHGDERLTYLSNLNYGAELIQRIGFEQVAGKGGETGFAAKQKYVQYMPLASQLLRDALVAATAKIAEETVRVADEGLGADGLRHLMGAEPTFSTQKALGVGLGAVCGDILGLPFANWTPEVLDRWFGTITEFHAMPPAPRHNDPVPERYWREGKPGKYLGAYSGEMAAAVAIAMAVLEAQSIDCKAIPRRVVEEDVKYKGHDKRRMYPEALKFIIAKLAQGDDPKTTGFCLNPSGLKPAEAPQLVTFLGLLFKDEESDQVVMDAVKGSLLPFVVHPDGVGVAFVYVCCLKYLYHQPSVAEFDVKAFMKHCREKAGLLVMSNYFTRSLDALDACFDNDTQQVDKEFLTLIVDDEDDEVTDTTFQSAIGAFCGAMYAFVNSYKAPVLAVSAAVHLGEAGNTMASIAGGLCGALHGARWIPRCWYGLIENGDGRSTAGIGRDRIIQLSLDCASGTALGKTRHAEAPQKYVAPKAALPKKAEPVPDAKKAVKVDAPPPGMDRFVGAMPLSMRKFARNKFEVKGV